jgi:peptide/nickel transport system permease protein
MSAGAAPHSVPARTESPFARFAGEFAASRIAMAALCVALLLALAAIFAPWITPQNPYNLADLNILDSRLPPGSVSGSGMTYWLGTDGQGRDMLSAIIYGLRISLGIGIGSALIAGIIGALVGLFSSYAGGKVDAALMRLVDLQLSFPSILVALMIIAGFGKGVFDVLLALVIVGWAFFARAIRASALVERRREYIEAAECLGLPPWRILLRHFLPNCLPPLTVVATMQIAQAILLEATLSFLGLGVPVTQPSLGLLVANGYQYMLSGQYWITFFPGIVLLIAVVSFTLIGDRLRVVFNPRFRR